MKNSITEYALSITESIPSKYFSCGKLDDGFIPLSASGAFNFRVLCVAERLAIPSERFRLQVSEADLCIPFA